MAQTPRDGFVLYQERLQRQNEGDDVDMTSYKKTSLELQHIDKEHSVATVSFFHEDHTLGNPLRHVLMQQSAVTTAGYSIPHPLEPKMVLHVQSKDYAVEVVAKGLDRLADICTSTLKSFEAAERTATHN